MKFSPGTEILLHSITSGHSQKYWLTRPERHTACLNYPIMNNLNLLQRQDINQSFFFFFSFKYLTIHPPDGKTSSSETTRLPHASVRSNTLRNIYWTTWCQIGKIESSVLWPISPSPFISKSFYCQRFFFDLVPTFKFTTFLSRL